MLGKAFRQRKWPEIVHAGTGEIQKGQVEGGPSEQQQEKSYHHAREGPSK